MMEKYLQAWEDYVSYSGQTTINYKTFYKWACSFNIEMTLIQDSKGFTLSILYDDGGDVIGPYENWPDALDGSVEKVMAIVQDILDFTTPVEEMFLRALEESEGMIVSGNRDEVIEGYNDLVLSMGERVVELLEQVRSGHVSEKDEELLYSIILLATAAKRTLTE